jgi:3-deoxy-D-manno-octulosonic-acid transferase
MNSDRSATHTRTQAAKGALPHRVVMKVLYSFFVSLYAFAIRLFGLVNAKAAKWTEGRKDWQHNYAAALQQGEKRIWFHCASVGEFEQAKPVIEALRKDYPGYKIVVTFFSPSGYEACRNNALVDYIFYLPRDSSRNAAAFVDLVDPLLVAFVKYEFWYFYLAELRHRGVVTMLVSGAFRLEQPFFKWYGGLFRDMLLCFDYYFLQDQASAEALATIGITRNIVISGDTRYDRVSAIAAAAAKIPAVDRFKGACRVLIAGSSWPADEELLHKCIGTIPENWKMIIAPHEVDAGHIRKIQQLFGNEAILFSELDAETTGADKRILVINNIGVLSRLFAYGDIAFIGGGFKKGGIHNILEPAVFGLPVIFGPVYEKFVEARKLVQLQLVFPVADANACGLILNKLVSDEQYRAKISRSLTAFMKDHTGATQAIMDVIRLGQLLG